MSNSMHPPMPSLATKGRIPHFVGGSWMEPKEGLYFQTFNPATGEVITEHARGSVGDVDAAVQSARAAFTGTWSRFKPQERQALLSRVGRVVEDHFDELALLESLDMGAPLARTRGLRDGILRTIDFFASQALSARGQTVRSSLPGLSVSALTLRDPVGVVGGIIPWNGPLISQWWVLGGVLATGCTAVMKPAEEASLTVIRTAELLLEAGLPEGVVNVVTGLGEEAGAALAAHPNVDRVAFTGSTATGREIIKASAGNIKRISLELGGKSPDIIFADADLEKAVPGAAMGVFSNSGQVCFAGTRVLVQRSIHEEFVTRMTDFARSVVVGDPFDDESQLGPLVSQSQMDRVLGYCDIGAQEGAELTLGGDRVSGVHPGGYFVQPTIFNNVAPTMTIAKEEIFGPVVSVMPFETPDEALALANDTIYGLGGAVWSRDIGIAYKMMRGIEAGTVWVNCYGLIDPTIGFGGYKQSGYGWKGGTEHIDSYLYQKAVYINEE